MALQSELQILINNLKSAGVATDDFSKALKEAGDDISKLNVLQQDLLQALRDAESTVTGLYGRLRAITSEFKGQVGVLDKTRNALRTIEREAQKLVADEQLSVDLNRLQLKSLERKVKFQKSILLQEALRLKDLGASETSLQAQINQIHQIKQATGELSFNQKKELSQLEEKLAMLKSIPELRGEEKGAYTEIIEQIEKRLELEKIINKNMGVTGALVEGTGALMERLGMRSGIFHDAMKDSAEYMREQSKAAGKNATAFKRLEIAAGGFSIVVKGFAAALKDPAVIIGTIIAEFFQVNKASVEFNRLTGQSAMNIAAANSRMATSVDFLETAAELTRQIGLGATNIFTPNEIATLAEAKNLLGLSAEQAGSLGVRAKVAGVNIDFYKESIVSATNSYNSANNQVVAHGIVLQDVLNTSDSIALSLGGNPKKIAAAAAAARTLGMELSKVDAIAESMMDFSTSIGSELEAQLLTGMNINLAKARELALNNDLQGLSAELAKNGADAAQFAGMNRIQQTALAKALGMSRDELGKMAQQQLLVKNASIAQQAAARGVTIEEMEQMNVQEQLQKSLAKLAQAFTPILEVIVPIVEGISNMLNIISGGLGTGVGRLIGYFTTGLTLITGMKSAFMGIVSLQKVFNSQKMVELGLGGKLLSMTGFQNAAEMYKLTLMEGQGTLAALRAGLEQTILGSLIAQIGRAVVLLGVQMGIASASLLANSAVTFGIGAAIAVGAAIAAFSAFKSATADDMISPGYGKRTLTGPEGSIQLNDKDTVIAGTELFNTPETVAQKAEKRPEINPDGSKNLKDNISTGTKLFEDLKNSIIAGIGLFKELKDSIVESTKLANTSETSKLFKELKEDLVASTKLLNVSEISNLFKGLKEDLVASTKLLNVSEISNLFKDLKDSIVASTRLSNTSETSNLFKDLKSGIVESTSLLNDTPETSKLFKDLKNGIVESTSLLNDTPETSKLFKDLKNGITESTSLLNDTPETSKLFKDLKSGIVESTDLLNTSETSNLFKDLKSGIIESTDLLKSTPETSNLFKDLKSGIVESTNLLNTPETSKLFKDLKSGIVESTSLLNTPEPVTQKAERKPEIASDESKDLKSGILASIKLVNTPEPVTQKAERKPEIIQPITKVQPISKETLNPQVIARNDNRQTVNNIVTNNNQEESKNITISTKQLEDKLDRLIALVGKGGDVLLDGNKVGSALVMGSYKSS